MYPHAEGDALGRYRLGRLIGSGGMGEVYLARDDTLRRDVAVKFLTSGAPGNDILTHRLVQEARAVAAIDHPAICPVHDVGVDSTGRPYMVMQYVPGETLAARLARGPLPVAEALRTCAQIADALATAHRRGIIHRDLKPQNVMLTPTGQPKLLDFGIAKVLPSFENKGNETTSTSLTDTYNVVGTPAYMSPEQIQLQRLDGRSDLFSLGCIAYECLTGHRAFSGKQTVDVMGQVLHLQPKAPSTLRPELDQRHDELIRRLLAKDPAERFQSAEEVVGAIRLLQPDISSLVVRDEQRSRFFGLRKYSTLAIAAGLALIVTIVALWVSTRAGLPTPPADAARYYQLGTDALREGTFHSAAAALTEAVRLFPKYALAYARLAEAHAEMDDDGAAAQDLVRMSNQVPDMSRLSQEERLRLDAIRALVLGDPDASVRAYRALTSRRPNDAGAWVDLARAQEAAAQLSDARTSAQRAISIDPRYAAAHLRLGIIESFQAHKEPALAAFSEAERLYGVASNKEGEAEVLLRRGMLQNTTGDLAGARASLERAREIAGTLENSFQVVQTELLLGSVMVSEGRSTEAEQLVSGAVKQARDSGLETVAADGLIDLATTLMTKPSRLAEAEAPLRTALELAERRGAQRTRARAATQLASVQSSRGKPADALKTLEPALAFFKEHKYRNFELTALTIATRAYQDLDNIPKARELANEIVKEAEASGDESRLALALNNLAVQATILGSLPEALTLRERAETIHRRLGDTLLLPYDLTNRAELLIKLGRFDEASKAMDEVDAGAAKKFDSYVSRVQRVAYLRALSAAFNNQIAHASTLLAAVPRPSPPNTTSALTSALDRYIQAKQGRRAESLDNTLAPTESATGREREYWTAATALARRDMPRAIAAAATAIDHANKIGNDELTWRTAAIGVAAARTLGDAERERAMRTIAVESRTRLRTSWGTQVTRYDQRPDLIELRKASGLED